MYQGQPWHGYCKASDNRVSRLIGPSGACPDVTRLSGIYYMCKVLYHLFARLLKKKRTFFPPNWILLQVRLYYVTIVYDIIRFQIDLVNLASSKNFVGQLHNQ